MSKLTAVGMNIFAGLFTKGVKDAGFDVKAQLEHGQYGVATAKLNFPKLPIIVGRENWNETQFKAVDFAYCNPPCAAFSTAGKGNWEDQLPRLRYIYDCVEAGIAMKPKAWCWESVTQAWGKAQQYVLQMAERWNDAGYHCTVVLLDNQYLGTPQVRKRFYLFAHKHPLVWPKFLKPITAGEVLKSVAKLKVNPDDPQPFTPNPLWKHLWKLSRAHGGYLAHALKAEGRRDKKGRELEGGRPSVMVRVLKPDEPAPVMIASHLRFHPYEPRGLNWNEWRAIVGLPQDWKTSERSMSAASAELARAVMPATGKWLATAVKNGLKLPPIKGQPTTRFVDIRDPEHIEERELFKYEGPTITPLIPPPIPLLTEQKGRRPRGSSSTGPRGPRLAKPGSGVRIRELLMKGKDADEILSIIHKEFPGSKATKSDVSWNKGRLKREGAKLP